MLLLAPELTPENAEELLQAAAFKSKREIEQLLARRLRQAVSPAPELSMATADAEPLSHASRGTPEPELSVPERITSAAPSFPVHASVDEETRDMLGYAKSLLSHQVPSGDTGQVLRKLLEIAIPRLEKQKFGGTGRTRSGRTPSKDPRHVPMCVKSAVWLRDGGQCTFVSEAGKRCAARRMLEFDHALEVARGGQASVENIRLRCRAHNQYTAEQTLGAGFMQRKRDEAQRSRAAKPVNEKREDEKDVVPWLRTLGYRADQARRAAQHCEQMAEATLEERLKAALRFLAPPHRHVPAMS